MTINLDDVIFSGDLEIQSIPTPVYALTFDGIDDYVALDNVPIASGATNYSVSMWLSCVPGANGIAFGVGSDGFHVIQIVHTPANILSFGTYEGGWQTITAPIPSNQWVHVVCVKNGGNGNLYINNIKYTGLTNTVNSLTLGTIGALRDTFGGFRVQAPFAGSIDEVQIWNTSLNDSDVNNLYNSGSGVYGTSDANTTGLWHMDEGTGITTLDFSGNGNTGDLTNGPGWIPGKVQLP